MTEVYASSEGCTAMAGAVRRFETMRYSRARAVAQMRYLTSALHYYGDQFEPATLAICRDKVEALHYGMVKAREFDTAEAQGVTLAAFALLDELEEARRRAEDAAHRERFRRHGARRMHRRTEAVEPDPAACAICADGARGGGGEDGCCAHWGALCGGCAARLDVCPFCRQPRQPRIPIPC